MTENSYPKTKSFRIGKEMDDAFAEIRFNMGYATDAEVFRAAIGTQLRIARAHQNGEKVYVADADGNNIRELVFVTNPR